MWRGQTYAAPPPAIIRWRLSVAGTALAISLDEIKKWTNRPTADTYFDAEITAMALAAQRVVESYCQFSLTFNTWVGTLPGPLTEDRVRLVRRPFVDVTAVEYVALDGTITTMPSTLYHVLPVDQDCGMIFGADGEQWPDMASRHDAVRITARSGYAVSAGDTSAGAPALPEDIRRALLMTIASMDASHGDDSGGSSNTTVYAMKQAQGAGTVPQSAKMLLAPYVYRSVRVA